MKKLPKSIFKRKEWGREEARGKERTIGLKRKRREIRMLAKDDAGARRGGKVDRKRQREKRWGWRKVGAKLLTSQMKEWKKKWREVSRVKKSAIIGHKWRLVGASNGTCGMRVEIATLGGRKPSVRWGWRMVRWMGWWWMAQISLDGAMTDGWCEGCTSMSMSLRLLRVVETVSTFFLFG